MKKKLIFLILLNFGVCYANPVNWVVAKVNNEPITNFEVSDVMKKMGSKNEKDALEFLINEKLQVAEIKKRDITVSPYEITTVMEDIAKKNRKSLKEFEDEIRKKGMTVDQFRAKMANDIKQQKLLGAVFAKADKRITPERVKEFYTKNPSLFTTYESVSVTRFAAKTKQEIQDAIKGNVGMFVVSHKLNIPKKSLNKQTAFAFLNMKKGEFTPIMQHPQGFYEVLRVDSKNGLKTVSFEEAEEQVFRMLAETERRKEAEIYFEKLRDDAVIEIFEPKKNNK